MSSHGVMQFNEVREMAIFLMLINALRKKLGPTKLSDFNEGWRNISGKNGKYLCLYQGVDIDSGYCIDRPEHFPTGGCSWFDESPNRIDINLEDWFQGVVWFNEDEIWEVT